MVGSHEKVLSIISFFKNCITALNSKALVSQGCGENTNLCFHGVGFLFMDYKQISIFSYQEFLSDLLWKRRTHLYLETTPR
jgi:hypothetical protein